MNPLGLFRSGLSGLTVLFVTSLVLAQEPTVQQLQAQYDEALQQLQAAQDRKNELANENERLRKRVESLTQTLSSSREQAIFLQSHFNLWQMYVAAFPEVGRWFESSVRMSSQYGSDPTAPFEFTDFNWPFSAIEPSTTVASE